MSKHRFRYSRDFDVPGASPEAARQLLKDMCVEHGIVDLQQALDRGQFEYLGDAEVQDIPEEDRAQAQELLHNKITLMSVQFRGENFTVLCTSRDVGTDKRALKPIALLLQENHIEHLTDPMGGKAIIVEDEN